MPRYCQNLGCNKAIPPDRRFCGRKCSSFVLGEEAKERRDASQQLWDEDPGLFTQKNHVKGATCPHCHEPLGRKPGRPKKASAI